MSVKHPPLIQIIDDEPGALRSLINLLRGEGLRVSVAVNGRQGFHRTEALLPDLILLDVRMPDMDGFAVCRLLKESPRTRNIPVIFLSSATGDQQLEGLLHGGVDYVTKPCIPAEVVARVRIHLRLAPRTLAMEPVGSTSLLSQDELVLRAAMRLIGEKLNMLPSLAEIAHKVGTHDKKLSAIFRAHLGTTVFAWVREERLRCSRELLADSHMSMQAIAEQIGFRSACNFITAFRERMGVTPSRYRQSLHDAASRMSDTMG